MRDPVFGCTYKTVEVSNLEEIPVDRTGDVSTDAPMTDEVETPPVPSLPAILALNGNVFIRMHKEDAEWSTGILKPDHSVTPSRTGEVVASDVANTSRAGDVVLVDDRKGHGTYKHGDETLWVMPEEHILAVLGRDV